MQKDHIQLTLSRSEALILFEWLASFDSTEKKPGADEAEQIVLWGLETLLEKELPEILSSDYDRLLASAKQQLVATDE